MCIGFWLLKYFLRPQSMYILKALNAYWELLSRKAGSVSVFLVPGMIQPGPPYSNQCSWLFRSYWQIFSRQITARFAFLIPVSEPDNSVSHIWPLGSIRDHWSKFGWRTNKQVSNLLLWRQQFSTASDRPLEYSGTMHTKVFSVSGLLLKLVPLLNAYLFFRSQNTCSSSFFTACQTLYHAPSGIISSEVGTLLSRFCTWENWGRDRLSTSAMGLLCC